MSAARQLTIDAAAAGAVLSDDGCYRYRLWRAWAPGPRMAWVMLNPSTADESVDDPTIRRCIAFARREGCAGIDVVNLFALRATDPRELERAADPVGPDNAVHILDACRSAALVVAGWGAHRLATDRGYELAGELENRHARLLFCFGHAGAGAPRHPLYLRGDAVLRTWLPTPPHLRALAGTGA